MAENDRGREAARSNYRRQLSGRRSKPGSGGRADGSAAIARMRAAKFDDDWGYKSLQGGEGTREGYLMQMAATTVEEDGAEYSAVDLYFLQQDGDTFKATLRHEPYFYVACKPQWSREVSSYLERTYTGRLSSVTVVEKEDLDMPNHLSGLLATYLQLKFRNVRDLMDVRNVIRTQVDRNRRKGADAEHDIDAVRANYDER